MPNPWGGVVMTPVVTVGANCTVPVVPSAAEYCSSIQRRATQKNTLAKSGEPLTGVTKPPNEPSK